MVLSNGQLVVKQLSCCRDKASVGEIVGMTFLTDRRQGPKTRIAGSVGTPNFHYCVICSAVSSKLSVV
jgi:hypothetical protein